jgi:hypothetical protein
MHAVSPKDGAGSASRKARQQKSWLDVRTDAEVYEEAYAARTPEGTTTDQCEVLG